MPPIASELTLSLYNFKMLEETEDLDEAQSWAHSALGVNNAAKYFMGVENFVVAYKNAESFSFVIEGESIYSQLYGPNAHFDERCQSVALADSSRETFHGLKRGGSSQFWEAKTRDNGFKIELLEDYSEINDIIDEHALDSSVRPGDPEEIFWGGVRNEFGELASLAAVVKWQSGLHVMVSVVTRSQDRGKGLATKLSAGMVSHSFLLGISEVGLGIRDGNFAAVRVYEKTGFNKLANFTRYSRE